MARATNTAPRSNDFCSPAAQVCPVSPADAKARQGQSLWLKTACGAGEKLETSREAADWRVTIALAAEPAEGAALYWRSLPADPYRSRTARPMSSGQPSVVR